MKKTTSLLLVLLLSAALLTGCAGKEASPAEGSGRIPAADGGELEAPELSAAARSGSVQPEEGTVVLDLAAYPDGLTITEEGSYLLSGSLSGGQILVDAPEDAKVKLILNGVDVTMTGHAAVYARSADKLILSSAPGSVNRLVSTGEFVQTDDSKVDAAVFAKCDLSFSGEGVIDLICQAGHGAVSKDDLKLKGGELNVSAGKKGLEGKDSICLEDGVLAVQAGGKGLCSEGEEEGETGSVLISGGTLRVLSGDDAIHASALIQIDGGELALSAEDDAVHADRKLIVTGGSIRVLRSYEGLEARDILISGGSIVLLASDDGINAADGDAAGADGPFGPDPFRGDSGSTLTVSGGLIVINAEGDGLDVNGDLLISGGEIYVSGPTRGGNGALDYGTAGVITGGTVIAVGSANMAENFGSGSTQGSILLNVGSQAAGAAVSILDSDGNTLASYSPEKSYESVLISAPGLLQGGTYTVTAGSFRQSVTLDELIFGQGFGGPGMGPGGGFGGVPGGAPGGGPGGASGGDPGGRPGGGPGRPPT